MTTTATYVGIDFGTSGARIAAIAANGTLLTQMGERFPHLSPEQWAATWSAMLIQLLASLPITVRSNLRAIAINGTSSTVLLCDADGCPLAPPLLYNDARGAAEVAPLQALLEQQQITGQDTVLSATSSLVKLLWWSRQAVIQPARYFLHQADWLAFQLHGQLGLSDYHNSLKLGYDLHQLGYPQWLQALPIAPLLPRVVPPGTAISPLRSDLAKQLGIPATCQICAGTTDSIAAFLASGASQPGEAVTSLGSTLVVKLLSCTPIEDRQYGIYSHRWGDLWLVGGASNTGGAVLQNFFSPAELATLSEQIPPDRPSPYDYYPLLQPGERFPINDPQLLPRLEPRSPHPVEFLHGLLESMARIEARAYHLLQALGADRLTHVYTAGGGAKNAAWTRIRARHLQVPVEPSQHGEAAYGTALLARRSATGQS